MFFINSFPLSFRAVLIGISSDSKLKINGREKVTGQPKEPSA